MSATTITPSVLCGVLVPYALEADLDASTVGQASPVAGVPLPAEDSAGRSPGLALSASGAQTAGTVLSVATQDAGNVGSATYRVKRTVAGVADASWRGADLPNVLVGFNGIGWASANRQTHPHAVTLPDDTQVVVYAERNSVIDTWDIKTRVWSPTSETYAAAVTVVTGLDKDHAPWPFLILMPDPQNRNGDPVVLLGHWDADDTNNVANVNLYISRDGGASWGGYARSVLEDPITLNSGSPYYVLGRIRGAMVGAQIVLFAWLTSSASPTENVFQWASATAAASFDYVGLVGDSAKPTGYPDVVSRGMFAYLAYSYDDDIYIAPVRNAFVRVLTGTVVGAGLVTVSASTAAGTITAVEFCVLSYDVRRVVLHTANAARVFYTDTATSEFLAGGLWFEDGNSPSTDKPTQIASTLYRGQVRIYANMDSATTTYENRLTRIDLGGLSSVTFPNATLSTRDSSRISWDTTYIPTALPSAYGGATPWTASGAGADDITTTVGWHRITTTANQRYYTNASTLAATDQMLFLARVRQVAGGSVAAREGVVGVRWARVGIGFQVEVRCSATQIRSYDVNAGATLNTVTVAVSSGIDILMAISGTGKVSIWYRLIGTDEDRNFIELETATTCTDDAGAGGTTGSYYYGSLSTSTATFEYIPFGIKEYTEFGINDLATSFTNPTTLRGIPYGTNTYALAGTKLTATGGPTLAGDAWTITPDAEYPYRHALPMGDSESTVEIQGGHRPSAREDASAWRSTATSGYLAFRYRGSRNRFVQAALGFHVEGLNVRTYGVYGYNEDGAAWVSLGTGTQYKTVRFTRTNANSPMIQVDTGNASTDEPYLYEGELVGGYVKFVTSGDVRPIQWNGEGRWSSDGAHGLPYIELDPDSIDASESTTGSLEIWYPRSTFVTYLLPTQKFSKYALYWSGAMDTYEGYIKANIVAIGQVLPMVRTRDFGTIIEQSNPGAFSEMRSGLRFGRQQMIAPRINMTVPLIAPQDQAPLLDATTTGLFSNPFKLSSTASMPLAGTVGDTAGKIAGIWRRTCGSRDPVVYLRRLAYGPPDTMTLLGREAAGHYSRITSQPRFTDRYGRDTGTAHGSVYVGENVLFEGEL